MNDGHYDIAFAPINARLISLSERLAKPLTDRGIRACILKTSFQGEELSGWSTGEHRACPVLSVPALQYEGSSNFLKYTVRTIAASRKLTQDWAWPFRVLVVFMDRYAEGGILTRIAKLQGIPTVLFQEGFHARMKNYSLRPYDVACWLRSKILAPWFNGGCDGMQSDYVAVWSEFGMKENMIARGRAPQNIFVVGNPLPPVERSEDVRPLQSPPVIMVAHQPLNHRYATKAWNDTFYAGVVSDLCRYGFHVLFKAHPRCVADGELQVLKEEIERRIANYPGKMQWVDRKIISEDLLPECDALITALSVTAYTALRMECQRCSYAHRTIEARCWNGWEKRGKFSISPTGNMPGRSCIEFFRMSPIGRIGMQWDPRRRTS